jgi:hypothetical protein
MIPLFAAIQLNGRRCSQLLLPLFLLWLLLLPFLLLALPFLVLFAIFIPVPVWRGSRAVLALLGAMRGTRVEISAPGRLLSQHVW